MVKANHLNRNHISPSLANVFGRAVSNKQASCLKTVCQYEIKLTVKQKGINWSYHTFYYPFLAFYPLSYKQTHAELSGAQMP